MNIEEAVKSKIPSPQIKAIINLRYTSNCVGAIQNAFMSDFGMTMPQFNILRILRGAGEEITVNTIKDRMIEKSPNTTRLMDKLIDKELITRSRCSDDRRVVYIKITGKGLSLLSDIDEQLGEKQERFVTTGLTDDEANQLSDLLDKLRNNVQS